jgi:hypothetical protein
MISLARRQFRPEIIDAGRLREKAASEIDLSRDKGPWPRDGDWRDNGHVELEILALPPEQKLVDAVSPSQT